MYVASFRTDPVAPVCGADEEARDDASENYWLVTMVATCGWHACTMGDLLMGDKPG